MADTVSTCRQALDPADQGWFVSQWSGFVPAGLANFRKPPGRKLEEV